MISGTAGITNVWASHMYSFSTILSREKDNVDNFVGSTEENTISESDIPVRDPVSVVGSSNSTRSNFNDNPFLNIGTSPG